MAGVVLPLARARAAALSRRIIHTHKSAPFFIVFLTRFIAFALLVKHICHIYMWVLKEHISYIY